MKSVNQVILLGNVTRDVDYKDNGSYKYARFSVATSEGGYKKADGTEVKEKTQFHNVIAWRGLADVANKLFKKGDTVYIQGHLEYSEREEGGKKVRYTDVVADEVSLCHSRQSQQSQPSAQPPFQQKQPFQPFQQPMQPQYMTDPNTGRPVYQGPDGQWYFADQQQMPR